MNARVYKEFGFEAAHRLPNVPADHKCARLHGHSFRARITVEGRVNLDELTMAVVGSLAGGP